jgi:hypothetical protein
MTNNGHSLDRPKQRIGMTGSNNNAGTSGIQTQEPESDSIREDLLRVLSTHMSRGIAEEVNTVPGSTQQAFGCYYLDSAAQAERILNEDGVSPTLSPFAEQQVAESPVDEFQTRRNAMQAHHKILDEVRPDLDGFDTSRHEAVRWWPTVETCKRKIKRVHPDRAQYIAVGVCPRRLLDAPVLVADFSKAVRTFVPLMNNIRLYGAQDIDVPFYQSDLAEPVREHAQEYWNSATVCTQREALESAIFCDSLDWPELFYPQTVRPTQFDEAVVVD